MSRQPRSPWRPWSTRSSRSSCWPRTFRLALLDKDVGIALDVLNQNGVPSDATAVAKRFMADTRKALGEEADHVEAIKEIERRAGVEIR